MRPTCALSVAVVAAACVAACGGLGGDLATETTTDPPSPTSSSGARPAIVTTVAPAPPWLTAITEAGYPRDLLERGRVNVETTNASDQALHVTSRELIADHFMSPGPEQRRSSIAAGATVDLQTAHGEVVDCEADTPITATAVLTYATQLDPTERVVAVPIGDTVILEQVRTRTCAARALTDAFELTFSGAAVDDDVLTVHLTFTRRTGTAAVRLGAGFGTVLFGVERTDAHPSEIAPTDRAATITLEFRVNRCDPHALAETTRKYGLQLQVGVAGDEFVWVDIDTAGLHQTLDEILAYCEARSSG